MTDSRKESRPAPTAQELRARAEITREQLGETVEALAAKADVKARVHNKAAAAKHQVSEKAAPVRDTVLRNRTLLLAAAGAAGALLVFLAVRRTQR
ncbi:DUF3618 domain-containing protein [Actinacidiphila soli]|uniref:DUF3618 domain-containing protein n=1 Tax=Actinacidiphila soli TaxID=2487275 RepID=UPI000FCB0A4C|nr:DUF3618 domain-containing protein [Actinacidiphila soli]